MGATLKIVHAADVHLGMLGGLGEKTAEHHRLITKAFEGLVDLAAREADVLLLVGDLLDRQPVAAGAAGAFAERAAGVLVSALDRAKGLRVIVIAGNHDPAPVYRRPEWRVFDTQERAFIVTEPRLVEIDELGLAVAAIPWMGNGQAEWSRWPSGGMAVAAVHACSPPPQGGGQNFVLTDEEIGRWPARYVAMGHYHNASERRVGDKPVVYAGGPEILDVSHSGRGRVVRVEIDADGDAPARWEPVETGELVGRGVQRWGWQDLPHPRAQNLRARLEQTADGKALLRVRVEGRRETLTPLGAEDVAGEMAARFFHLDLIDETEGPVRVEDLEAGPGEAVLGHLLEIGRKALSEAEAELERARAHGDERAAGAAEEQAAVAREAMVMGYSMLATEREEE